jgi:hypothetical protein
LRIRLDALGVAGAAGADAAAAGCACAGAAVAGLVSQLQPQFAFVCFGAGLIVSFIFLF